MGPHRTVYAAWDAGELPQKISISIQISKLLQCGDTVTKPVKHSRYMTIHLLSHRTWTHGGPCAPKFELNRLDQGVDIGTFTGKAQLECKPQQ